MTFREKTAWASLLGTLLVWGYYFATLTGAVRDGSASVDLFTGRFMSCLFISLLLQIAIAILLAVMSPRAANAPADEREKMIELRATGVAFVVLLVVVLTVAGAFPFVAAASMVLPGFEPVVAATLLMSNGILASVVIAELVRASWQIILFRTAL